MLDFKKLITAFISKRGRKLTPVPIIGGVPRSGTTLLRVMLDAHPDMAIPSETHFLGQIANLTEPRRLNAEAMLSLTADSERWPDFLIDRTAFMKSVRALHPFDTAEAVRIFYRMCADRFHKPRWGDKTPDNLANMAAIQTLLPEALFIHMLRDGRDTALSILPLWWGPSTIPEAAKWWVARIQQGREQSRHLNHYLEVRYEDLVTTPEPTLRRVSEFLDLPWNDSMLDYCSQASRRVGEFVSNFERKGKLITAGQRRAYHQLVERQPDPSRIGTWRETMSRQDQLAFLEIAGPLMTDLGYPQS